MNGEYFESKFLIHFGMIKNWLLDKKILIHLRHITNDHSDPLSKLSNWIKIIIWTHWSGSNWSSQPLKYMTVTWFAPLKYQSGSKNIDRHTTTLTSATVSTQVIIFDPLQNSEEGATWRMPFRFWSTRISFLINPWA